MKHLQPDPVHGGWKFLTSEDESIGKLLLKCKILLSYVMGTNALRIQDRWVVLVRLYNCVVIIYQILTFLDSSGEFRDRDTLTENGLTKNPRIGSIEWTKNLQSRIRNDEKSQKIPKNK